MDKKQDHYSQALRHASSKNWQEAIAHAKNVPSSHDIWQQFPQYGMDKDSVKAILPYIPPNSGFFHELSQELPEDLDLKDLEELHERTPNDNFITSNLERHPSYYKGHEELASKMAPSHFWNSYERKVEPAHFATVKSYLTGRPEYLTDHRGKMASSHNHYIADGFVYEKSPHSVTHSWNEPRFYGNAWVFGTNHAIPHLKNHAERVQAAILKDPTIQKKWINSEPHIELHRGIGGAYAQSIAEKLKYNPEDHSVENKQTSFNVAPFSSWTTSPEQAERFATSRALQLNNKTTGDAPRQHGESVVVKKWMPLKDVLHSGYHSVHLGQRHIHPDEEEIVVAHPEGKMKIHSKEVSMPHLAQNPSGDKVTPVNIRKKPQP